MTGMKCERGVLWSYNAATTPHNCHSNERINAALVTAAPYVFLCCVSLALYQFLCITCDRRVIMMTYLLTYLIQHPVHRRYANCKLKLYILQYMTRETGTEKRQCKLTLTNRPYRPADLSLNFILSKCTGEDSS